MLKQNPFSLYDFLGYFIPGALLFYIYIFIEKTDNFSEGFSLNTLFSDEKNIQFEHFLFFIIVSYGLGHLINFISSITVEKYANWIYNYPSKYLLGFNNKPLKKSISFKKIVLSIILLPIVFYDFVLGYVLGFKSFYTRKLDRLLIEIILEKGQMLVNQLYKNISGEGSEMTIRDHDFHRLFLHYTFENSKNHQFKLINYVVLYGFLRSLTFISVVLFWYLAYSRFCLLNDNISYLTLFIVGFIGYVFFMAFMKFYRRYSLECLMLVAIDKDITYD